MNSDTLSGGLLPPSVVPTAIEAYTQMAAYYRGLYGESLLCGRPNDEYRRRCENAEDNVIALQMGRPIRLIGGAP